MQLRSNMQYLHTDRSHVLKQDALVTVAIQLDLGVETCMKRYVASKSTATWAGHCSWYSPRVCLTARSSENDVGTFRIRVSSLLPAHQTC